MTYPHLKAKESFLPWGWSGKWRESRNDEVSSSGRSTVSSLGLPGFRWTPAQLQHSSSEEAPWALLFNHSDRPQQILQGMHQRSSMQLRLLLPKWGRICWKIASETVRDQCVSVVWRQGWPSIHSPNNGLAVRSTAMLPSFRLGRKIDPQYN